MFDQTVEMWLDCVIGAFGSVRLSGTHSVLVINTTYLAPLDETRVMILKETVCLRENVDIVARFNKVMLRRSIVL